MGTACSSSALPPLARSWQAVLGRRGSPSSGGSGLIKRKFGRRLTPRSEKAIKDTLTDSLTFTLFRIKPSLALCEDILDPDVQSSQISY